MKPDIIHTLYPQLTHAFTWMMSPAEQLALLRILDATRPAAALEVGTAWGGSLQHIRHFAPVAYSIDIDPTVRQRLAPHMPNVEFLTGSSRDLIGGVLQRCSERNTPLGFALIDGDHSYAGINGDLRALLKIQPQCPLWVLMHDSSNPDCRAGIADAPWHDNPYVHSVELDFVTGAMCQDPQFDRQVWGGLALALLLPNSRTHVLEVTASRSKNYTALWQASAHYPCLRNKITHWLRQKLQFIRRRFD